MLYVTEHTVPVQLLNDAVDSLSLSCFKHTINQPTGDFFYDPWKISDEFKDTVWEKILNSLPFDKGEARLITLESGQCYFSHADIDNRWHLNLTGNQSYLIDLDTETMFKLEKNNTWYTMIAEHRHSAANFGQIPRVQLVVRQLLKNNNLINPIHVKIEQVTAEYDYRYTFDNTISPWLNQANALGYINQFQFINDMISFNIDQQYLADLEKILPAQFRIVQ